MVVTPAPAPASCTVSRVGWYSDAQSAIARAALVGAYQLAGIAEWTIGGEDLAQWAACAPTPRPSPRCRPPCPSVLPRSLYGGRGTVLRAAASSAGEGPAGARVTFLAAAGSAAWTTVGAATTTSAGLATFVAPPVFSSGRWRALVPGTWARYAGSAVAAPTTVVRAAASLALIAPPRS